MFKLTARGLWAHKLRFALTGLAVVLGVAFMAGTMILTDTMDRTFSGLFETSNAGIDVVVQRPVAVIVEHRDPAAAGFENVILGAAATISLRREARHIFELHG